MVRADVDVGEGESGSGRSEDGTPNSWVSRIRILNSSGRREDVIMRSRGYAAKAK